MEDKVLTRLRKVQGQVEGIIRMYEDSRECGEVVVQISAVRAALAGVGKEILTSEAVACRKGQKHDKFDKLIKQLFEIS
ncbi:MAG: metal-sensitive transcriptional regulator [bacterium]